MNTIVNDALIPFINDGTFSMRRVRGLIALKEFIDRISTRQYLDERSVAELAERFGVRPTVVSWGDYFQTEMGTTLLVLSDDEFDRALDTVRFDMIAAYEIFCEQKPAFFTWVDETHRAITAVARERYTEEEQEILHLRILMDYYQNLGLIDGFTAEERAWFQVYETEERAG